MADYMATTVSNEFQINKPEEFVKLLKKSGVGEEGNSFGELFYCRKGDLFTIFGHASLDVYHEETDDMVEIGELIQPFLTRKSIAVFKEVGNIKCCFEGTSGYALVVTPNIIHFHSLDDWIGAIVGSVKIK